jgi:hypothetical protein
MSAARWWFCPVCGEPHYLYDYETTNDQMGPLCTVCALWRRRNRLIIGRGPRGARAKKALRRRGRGR